MTANIGYEHGLRKAIKDAGLDLTNIYFMDELFRGNMEMDEPIIPPNFLTNDGAYNHFVQCMGLTGCGVDMSSHFNPDGAYTDMGILMEHRKRQLELFTKTVVKIDEKEEERKIIEYEKQQAKNEKAREARRLKQESLYNHNWKLRDELDELLKHTPVISEAFRYNILEKFMVHVMECGTISGKTGLMSKIKKSIQHIYSNEEYFYDGHSEAMVGAIILNIQHIFEMHTQKFDDAKIRKRLSKNNNTYIKLSDAFKLYYTDYLYELHLKFRENRIKLDRIKGFHTDIIKFVDEIESHVIKNGVEAIMKLMAILDHIITSYEGGTIPMDMTLSFFNVLENMKNYPWGSIMTHRVFNNINFSYAPYTTSYPAVDINFDEYQPAIDPDVPVWENMNYERLPNEYWKAIPGYNNYWVSDFGRIRCNDVTDKGKKNKTGRIIKQQLKNGLLFANIHKDNKRKEFSMAYLVGVLWVDKEGKSFAHIDGNKHNNKASNLKPISKIVNL